MKSVLAAVVILAAVWSAVSVSGAPRSSTDDYFFNKIRITLQNNVSAPNFGSDNFSGGAMSNNLRNRWCVFVIDYYPKIEKNRRAWIDDVNLTLTVVFTAQSGGRKVPCVMNGVTRFVTIPIDSRRHTATMMIPPQLLDRYLAATGVGSSVNSSTFIAEATFTDRNGTVIGRGFYGLRGGNEQQLAAEFARYAAASNALKVEGGILPRSNTPWRMIRPDDYDLIKPDSMK